MIRCTSLDEFNKTKEKVFSESYPSDDGNLQGMNQDFTDLVPDSVVSENVLTHYPAGEYPAGKVDNLIVEYKLKEGVDLNHAATVVEEFWISRLSYSDFEAHFVERFPDKIVIHFVTRMNHANLYVAGRMTIHPPKLWTGIYDNTALSAGRKEESESLQDENELELKVWNPTARSPRLRKILNNFWLNPKVLLFVGLGFLPTLGSIWLSLALATDITLWNDEEFRNGLIGALILASGMWAIVYAYRRWPEEMAKIKLDD